MLFRGKPIEEVTKEDLLALLGEIEVGRAYDFKAELHLTTRDVKRELVSDVTSFANASGGHLLFGVTEKDGYASEVTGIDLENRTFAEIRECIDNIVRDLTEPRLIGVTMHEVPVDEKRSVIIVQVPKSWGAPHAVKGRGALGFYARRDTGKQLMEVAELRNAFLLSDTLAQRIRGFRAERLMRIQAGETPVPIREAPTAVLHLIPLLAFESGSAVAIADARRLLERTGFPNGGAHDCRVSFDGVLQFAAATDTQGKAFVYQYRQLFRTGIIEALNNSLSYEMDLGTAIATKKTERWLFRSCIEMLRLLQKLGVEPPILVSLSLLGFKDCWISPSTDVFADDRGGPIDRAVLNIPEVSLESYPPNDELPDLLRSILDTLWNSAGHLQWDGYERWKRELEDRAGS